MSHASILEHLPSKTAAQAAVENLGTIDSGGDSVQSAATQRVLDVAEELFMHRGYAAITLRDIANALEIKQASLYYHFPDGKEQLYVAVVARAFDRHAHGLHEAIAAAEQNLQSQLQSIARWFTAQPPLNFLGMMHADMPTLSEENRQRLMRKAGAELFGPLTKLFADAAVRQEIRPVQPSLMAGAFLSLLDGVRIGEKQQDSLTSTAMIDELIDILLNGMRPREEQTE